MCVRVLVRVHASVRGVRAWRACWACVLGVRACVYVYVYVYVYTCVCVCRACVSA